MHPERPSATAELVCSWRALEHLVPSERRILTDPYARGFLGPGRAAVVATAERLPPRALLALMRRVDRVLQGVLGFVAARHRAIDDLLVAREGLEQVVLLGAGYDTRSVRLAERLGEATLFEVDHPATARRKARLVPEVFGAAPRARTVSVPVDFERESLEERLLAAGFDPGRSTFWVWEGVTMYLDEAAVRATLGLIRRRSPVGSTCAFDVWCPPKVGVGRLALRELPALAMRLVSSEPFEWGPELASLGPFLASEGLELVEATPAAELIGRYTVRPRSVLDLPDPAMALCLARVGALGDAPRSGRRSVVPGARWRDMMGESVVRPRSARRSA